MKGNERSLTRLYRDVIECFILIIFTLWQILPATLFDEPFRWGRHDRLPLGTTGGHSDSRRGNCRNRLELLAVARPCRGRCRCLDCWKFGTGKRWACEAGQLIGWRSVDRWTSRVPIESNSLFFQAISGGPSWLPICHTRYHRLIFMIKQWWSLWSRSRLHWPSTAFPNSGGANRNATGGSWKGRPYLPSAPPSTSVSGAAICISMEKSKIAKVATVVLRF